MRNMKRLISIILMLSMLIAVLGMTAAFAADPEAPDYMTPGLELPPLDFEYRLIRERDTFYENGQEVFYTETKNEYTFFANGSIKTEKSTLTQSGSSDKSIWEYTYSEDGRIVKATLTETLNGKTTVTDLTDDFSGGIGVPSDPGGEPTITTDNNGQLISVKGDGWEYKMTYDAQGNQTSQTYYENGKIVSTYTWTYDAQGRMTTESYSGEMGSNKYTFSYDSKNRISGYDYTSGSAKFCATYQYAESGDNLTITAEIKRIIGGKQELTRKVVCEYQYIDTMPFTDVQKGKFYYDAVKWACQMGITTGTTATTFSPNDTCTRAQMVTFLWRTCGEPKPTINNSPFTDIKSGAYYYNAVLWACGTDVTKGTSATTFSPNDSCTRGQAVTFLWRLAGEPEPTNSKCPFGDVKSDAFYYKAVLWANETGITKGTSAATFAPNEICTRAQIVTFLYRYWDWEIS